MAKQTFGGHDNITVHSAHNALDAVDGYGTDYDGENYASNWEFWGKVATEMCELGDRVDYVYGSESYVPPIANACGAVAVGIDDNRSSLQISGTMMRSSPDVHWDYLPDAVKPFFAKKVCIVGGPYTGKSALADGLARVYNTPLIGDASPTIYDAKLRGSTPEDLVDIAALHSARANALLKQANKVIISDSDAFLSGVWHEALFGEPPEHLKKQAKEKRFDLYLLADSKDVPFTPSHSFPDETSWHRFTDTLEEELTERAWPFVRLVHSEIPKRITQSCVAINRMIWESGETNPIGWRVQA